MSHFDRERIPERVVQARGFVAQVSSRRTGPSATSRPRPTPGPAGPGQGRKDAGEPALLHGHRRPGLLRSHPRPRRSADGAFAVSPPADPGASMSARRAVVQRPSITYPAQGARAGARRTAGRAAGRRVARRCRRPSCHPCTGEV
ncbi:hypothetical protein [Micromonospora sp. NPDC050276]|uniref:hypothetical protein n=1 Tax=Micromonospora sp. NPDC050276 TaxID=3364278 RepID=UPI0037A33553